MKKTQFIAILIALALGCNGDICKTSGKTSQKEAKIIPQIAKHIDKGNHIERKGDYDLTGIAVVTGYFSPLQRGCDNDLGFVFNDFIITDAPSLFITHYRHLIDIGNTINCLSKGQLVIGLDFEKTPQFISDIKRSMITEQIKIVLEIPEPKGTEANTYFNIKSVMRRE